MRSLIYNKQLQEKLHGYYLRRWEMTEGRKGWLIGDCPKCGKHRKWGVNIEQGRTNCFVCGRGKSPLREIIEIEDNVNSLEEVKKLLNTYESIPVARTEEVVAKHYGKIQLPKEFVLINQGKSEYAEMFRRVLKSRGFSIEYLKLRGVGYCTSGEFEGRIIIPYINRGELVYYNARTIFDNTKFKNPKEEDLGYGKNTVIYNADCLYMYTKVYAVESAINALTLGDKAFGLGGKSLSAHHLSDIVRSPVEEVVIILDDDALREAYEIALSLVIYKRVRVVHMPVKKDVNDLGKKATLALAKQAPLLTEKEILKKLMALK